MISVDLSGLTGRNPEEYKARLKKVVEDEYNRGGTISIA